MTLSRMQIRLQGLRRAAKINIAVLDYIQEHIHEGMNTAEIDKIVYDMTTSMGGIRRRCIIRATRTACALR